MIAMWHIQRDKELVSECKSTTSRNSCFEKKKKTHRWIKEYSQYVCDISPGTSSESVCRLVTTVVDLSCSWTYLV